MLAVTTAIVASRGSGTLTEIVDSYRVALEVVTAISAFGLMVVLPRALGSTHRALQPV